MGIFRDEYLQKHVYSERSRKFQAQSLRFAARSQFPQQAKEVDLIYPNAYPILLLGNLVVIALTQAVFPRFFVTGSDKRQLKDVPKLRWYAYGITASAALLLIGLIPLRLPPYGFELAAFGAVILTGLALLFLEKRYLPNTRRHLVTLCWIGCICVLGGLYAWVTYG